MAKLSQGCLPMALALGLVLPCGLSAASRSTTSYDSMQGRTQLNEIKDEASSIEKTVGILGNETKFGDVDWQTQTDALNQVKNDVNDLGRDMQSLNSMKGQLAPWEQRELKQITPLEIELADATTDAIHNVNQRPNAPNAPLAMEFNTISSKARALDQSVNESEKVARLQSKLGQLQSGG